MKEEKTDTDFTASRDFPFLKEGTQNITMGNEELNSISLSKEVSTTDFLPVKYKFRRCLEKSHDDGVSPTQTTRLQNSGCSWEGRGEYTPERTSPVYALIRGPKSLLRASVVPLLTGLAHCLEPLLCNKRSRCDETPMATVERNPRPQN